MQTRKHTRVKGTREDHSRGALASKRYTRGPLARSTCERTLHARTTRSYSTRASRTRGSAASGTLHLGGTVEREKQILRWMLPDGLIKKVVQDELLECDDLSSNLLEFSPNLLDENVNWASVQRFFTKAAWIQITDKMAELQRDPKWKCGACHDDLLLSPSVVCESCLVWYHLKCVGLTAAPKKTLWFCRSCYATDDTVEKKETTETKVDTVLAIACFYFIFCRVPSHQRINSRVISLKKLKLQSNLSNVTKVIVEESFYITMVSVSTMM